MTREERINSALLPILEKMREHGATDEMCKKYDNGFHVGAMWADAHPHWISVENELPKGESEYDEFSEIVLATDGKDVYESRYHIGYNTWYTRNMFVFDDVSHWMPLPQAPKGGEE